MGAHGGAPMDPGAQKLFMKNNNTLPIGVFDSGVGGLTVLKALKERLPEESFLYLGDTARLPYGTKSADTVKRYAEQASKILIARGIKALVVACNTATTLALPLLQQQFNTIPIIGVLEPGAAAACRLSKEGKIAVIATEATIQSQAYQHAIKKIRPHAEVVTQSCGLLVALVEEGWLEGAVAESIVERYLSPLFSGDEKPDCLVLGCTHFPALLPVFRAVLGKEVTIVDSAQTTAEAVKEILEQKNLMSLSHNSQITFLVTDSPARFARVARYFLNEPLQEADVEWVELETRN